MLESSIFPFVSGGIGMLEWLQALWRWGLEEDELEVPLVWV